MDRINQLEEKHPSMPLTLGSWGTGRPDSVLRDLRVFPREMGALIIYVTVTKL